jgi:hypothetical protein
VDLADGGAESPQESRQRLNQIVGDGWIVLHVTAKRLREDLDGIVTEVRSSWRVGGFRSCPRPTYDFRG